SGLSPPLKLSHFLHPLFLFRLNRQLGMFCSRQNRRTPTLESYSTLDFPPLKGSQLHASSWKAARVSPSIGIEWELVSAGFTKIWRRGLPVIQVKFSNKLWIYTNGSPSVSIQADSLPQLLKDLYQNFPALKSSVLMNDGTLRPFCRI